MPRFSFCYNVYQEEEYIEYSLRSIYDFADEVIICYGPIDVMAEIGQPDATLDLIRCFPDPGKKIKHIIVRDRWRSLVQMRNVALSKATGDYMWIIDGDEVYSDESLDIIRKEISNFPDVMTFFVPCHLFWQDFHTTLGIFSFERIHKIYPGCVIIPGSNSMATAWGKPYRRISYVDLGEKYDCLFWHYSYVRSDEYMQLKQEYFAKRRDNYGATRGIHNWYENVWLASRTDIKSVMEKYGGLHLVTPSLESRIYKYAGEHPPVMTNHPYRRYDYTQAWNVPVLEWHRNHNKGYLSIRQESLNWKMKLWEYLQFLNTCLKHRR